MLRRKSRPTVADMPSISSQLTHFRPCRNYLTHDFCEAMHIFHASFLQIYNKNCIKMLSDVQLYDKPRLTDLKYWHWFMTTDYCTSFFGILIIYSMIHDRYDVMLCIECASARHVVFHHHLPDESTCIRTVLQVWTDPRSL